MLHGTRVNRVGDPDDLKDCQMLVVSPNLVKMSGMAILGVLSRLDKGAAQSSLHES